MCHVAPDLVYIYHARVESEHRRATVTHILGGETVTHILGGEERRASRLLACPTSRQTLHTRLQSTRSKAVLWPFYGRSMAVLWPFYGRSTAVLRPFYGRSTAVLRPSSDREMHLLVEHRRRLGRDDELLAVDPHAW